MSIKHSKASKARMARYSREELSKRMTDIAILRWGRVSRRGKKAVGAALLAARQVRKII